MTAPVTRFEVLLPLTINGSSDYNAIETFKTNLSGLVPTFYYPVYSQSDATKSYWAFFGYLTSTVQQNTALGYLNTLIATLSPALLPLQCTIWNGTSEP